MAGTGSPILPPLREKGSGIMIAWKADESQRKRIWSLLMDFLPWLRKDSMCVLPFPCDEEKVGVVHVFLVRQERAYSFCRCVDRLLAAGEIEKAREALEGIAELCESVARRKRSGARA